VRWTEREEWTMSTARGVLQWAGRLALSGVFIKGGWDELKEPGIRPQMATKIGLPDSRELVRLNGAAMLAGGVALATGILPRAAATGLVVSLSAVTAAGHRFWDEEDPVQRGRQQGQFLKNLGIIGGLLIYLSQPE
jgi:putative oxidoreductase